jgi:uncharacterized circularly permuted ATP-grasp superfamily protein/uncharacterized alpha-E superfamily protein
MVSGSGSFRPVWEPFLAAHGPLASEATAARWEAARRLLFQNGVTYQRYGDDQDESERLWPLDPIPLLLDAGEWQALAAGLIQRARLTEALQADLLGPQRLIAEGILPAGLLAGDAAFLRPCHGLMQQGGGLDFLVADLVRGPDGRWHVQAVRAQAPTGAGYVLENRMVLGQTLGPVFKACGTAPIAPFYEALKARLSAIAPRRSGPGGSVRGVFLTPGPMNEVYFEHAFLTRTLGLTLVEGADLTVRDQAVYLKTLAGLERVDVILRRVDDDFLDPLELRADSQLGVAGLLQAVRAGNVAVSNLPGSGISDALALQAYTPALCRALLTEEPLLPDVATVWGGTAGAETLLALLDRPHVLRPAFASITNEYHYGPDLPPETWEKLAARVRAAPYQWVVQQALPPSTVPVWRDGVIEARPLVLRCFLCRTPDGWQVMPGGLGRLSADSRFAAVSLQQAVGAKDVWITGAAAVADAPDISREPGPIPCDLPSRAADHLFWVGRYAERTDAMLRLLRAASARLVADARPGAFEQAPVLLRLMGWNGLIPWDLSRATGSEALRALRLSLEIAGDPNNPNGLRATIDRLRRAAGRVRDRLPEEIGRILSRLDRQSRTERGEPGASGQRLDDLSVTLAAFAGLELDGMSRGPGWRFLVIGRRLERAIGLTGALTGSGLTDPACPLAPILPVLLELAEARAAYSERHPAGLRRAEVLEILLADSDHPRCLAFQIEQARKQMVKLPLPGSGPLMPEPLRSAGGLLDQALAAALDPATARDPDRLAPVTQRINDDLRAVSNLFSQAYFSHVFARPT